MIRIHASLHQPRAQHQLSLIRPIFPETAHCTSGQPRRKGAPPLFLPTAALHSSRHRRPCFPTGLSTYCVDATVGGVRGVVSAVGTRSQPTVLNKIHYHSNDMRDLLLSIKNSEVLSSPQAYVFPKTVPAPYLNSFTDPCKIATVNLPQLWPVCGFARWNTYIIPK